MDEGGGQVRSGGNGARGRRGGLGRVCLTAYAAHYLPSVNLRSPGSAYFRVAEAERSRDGAQRVGKQEPGGAVGGGWGVRRGGKRLLNPT